MIKKLLVRKNIIILMVALALLTLGVRNFYLSQAPQFETQQVKKADISQIITSSGEIKSENEAELRFPISGKLASVNVKVNDVVNKGQLLASLDTQALSIALQQARNDWLAKDATAKKVEDDVKDHAKDESFTLRETRIKAQAARDSAYDAVKAAERNLQDATLTAPFTGVITKVHTQAGTGITTSSSIITIADPKNFVFRAEVNQSDIAKIALGQQATITLDAFLDRKITGKVSEIDIAATEKSSGNKIYYVKIALDDPSGLKLGMSGDTEITTSFKSDVLVIPKNAIYEKNGQKFVDVLEGGQIKQRQVQTGLKGNGAVMEIVSGLNEGEKVIIHAKY